MFSATCRQWTNGGLNAQDGLHDLGNEKQKPALIGTSDEA